MRIKSLFFLILGFSSFFVKMEPSPFDIIILFSFFLDYRKFNLKSILILLLFYILFNISSFFSFDPEKFSFIAFDVAFNAIKERMLFKENLKDSTYLKSNHEGYFFEVNIFQVDSSSGFENRGVHIYRYNNHELIRLD